MLFATRNTENTMLPPAKHRLPRVLYHRSLVVVESGSVKVVRARRLIVSGTESESPVKRSDS